MLSMYTGGSQTTLEIRMTLLTVSDDMAVLTLLTVSDDIAVFTAKQLYCCTNNYDLKPLNEDWNIIH